MNFAATKPIHILSDPTDPEFESAVRELRNKVYEQTISDNEWENCKHNWLKKDAVDWLRNKVREIGK